MLNLLNSSTPSPSAKSAAATAAMSKVPSSIKTTTAATAETEAAAAKNIGLLQAINMMQAACAKLGDESTLAALCAIKAQVLFGE